jgi:hypothetical protein
LPLLPLGIVERGKLKLFQVVASRLQDLDSNPATKTVSF